MTPHLEAKIGDYADTVLLPGDPLRAKWIAETYLDNVRQVNSVRNMLGFTGTYKGKSISVQGGGMGMPSNAIYIHELYNTYNVKTIIRVGSCGGIHKNLNVGDIVVATRAITDNAMINVSVVEGSSDLLNAYMKVAPKNTMQGYIKSSDWFYNPNKDWWKDENIAIAVEMETHILYTLANKFNKKALSVCTVADHFEKPEDMTSKERETSFKAMIESVLKIC